MYNNIHYHDMISCISLVQSAEKRTAIENSLSRQLSQRPSKGELRDRNIIPQEKKTRDQQWEERKVQLERKLSRRPTVKELRQKHILM